VRQVDYALRVAIKMMERRMMMSLRWTMAVLWMLCANGVQAELNWQAALSGEHRSEENKARDEYRHPQETLTFFGISPTMTVMEISPGGGWYTEVLAPLMAENGALIAAHSSPNGGSYARRSLGGFLKKLGENGEVFEAVEVATLQPPSAVSPAPAASVDLVLAFRNVHSWLRADQAEMMFATIAESLKPGGILGIVQHRGGADLTLDQMKKTAYVSEEKVIELAELAGLELDARSEINANPKDTKDHPRGVWTLPPTLAAGDEGRDRYLAIGESDRMTLRFIKPAE
jgi:predicted methyltransferase